MWPDIQQRIRLEPDPCSVALHADDMHENVLLLHIVMYNICVLERQNIK